MIMSTLLFVAVLFALLVALIVKWELNPRLCIPWAVLAVSLGAAVFYWLSNSYAAVNVGLRLAVAGGLGISLAALAYRFFRDPERVPPKGSNLIVSPADGRIVYVKQIREGEFPVAVKKGIRVPLTAFTGEEGACERGMQIGIAMSFIDVHVNRAPITGEIVRIHRIDGKFRSLKHLEALLENERVYTEIRSPELKVGIVQIASRLVRRIESYVSEKQAVVLGQRIGMIKFGSQVDVIVAQSANLSIKVEVGDEVQAGQTVIGTY
jgi:phosphatidylserine decarboxylase